MHTFKFYNYVYSPLRSLFLIFTTSLIFLLTFKTSAQFWVLTGGKADSLSKNLLEKYSIDISKVESYKHQINKESKWYAYQDSMKLEYKKDTLEINFKNVKPIKFKDKNVFPFLIESNESEEIDLSLDSVVLANECELYFLAKNFNEFAGPISVKNFKKGFKRLLHTSNFASSGIYVILVEKNESDQLLSHIRISSISYKEKDLDRSKFKVVSTSPQADCYPELNPQSFAVGRVFTYGRNNCSFSILNNENNDRRPLVLSARHCISGGDPFVLSANDIAAIENARFKVAWRHTCGSTTTESYRWEGTGSTYLAAQWPSDHLLVELEDDLPFSINYLGWNRIDVSNGTLIYGLHHPSGGVYQGRQHYSSGFINSQGADKYHINWTLGETAGGSSGSPLIRSQDHKVLGGLSFGNNTDYYFKLSNAWSTSNGPLKPHLSNVQNLSSMDALIPTQISGPTTLCTNSTTTYSMPNLLPGENVTWSVSGGLQIIASTGQSVTVKANGSNILGTLTATYTVIKDAEENTVHSLSNSIKIWQGKPAISLTNQTTNHTSSGYSLNMSSTGTNYLRINNTSNMNSVSWNFPSGWSYSGTSGFDVSIYSWSGSNSFTVSATNSCGTNSGYFFPTTGNYKIASNSMIYPNVATDFVHVKLYDDEKWDEVENVRIIHAASGKVHFSSNANKSVDSDGLKISLNKLPPGSYVVEVISKTLRDSHHLIIK